LTIFSSKKASLRKRAHAVKEVAWQLAEAMKQQKIFRNKMAALLKASRTQVDRPLDQKNDITIPSLQRAAARTAGLD
jgi:antitoxin HicB